MCRAAGPWPARPLPQLAGARAIHVVAAGGTLSALGAYLFIFNIWRTIDGRAPRPMPLPVVGALTRG